MGHLGEDVSIQVTTVFSPPVLAERPMYFNYHGALTGGSDVMGAAATQTECYFAEGYTGPGFEEWLCLLNEKGEAADVTVEYIFGNQPSVTKTYKVWSDSRTTINVNAECGQSGDVSMKVTSTQPIVAERPIYYMYRGIWPGGDTVTGASL